MNLNNIMLKWKKLDIKGCIFYFYKMSRIDKFRDKQQISGYQGLRGGGNREWLLNGDRITFGENESILELDKGDDCQPGCMKCPWNINLKIVNFLLYEFYLNLKFLSI